MIYYCDMLTKLDSMIDELDEKKGDVQEKEEIKVIKKLREKLQEAATVISGAIFRGDI